MFKIISSNSARTALANHLVRAVTAVALAGALVLPTVLPAHSAPRSGQLRISRAETGATQRLELGVNKSVIVDLPVQVREVIVSQPGVAAAIMRSKQRAIVQGISIGDTNIFFLDAAGNRIAVLDITVASDTSGLSASLARILPGSHIKVESFANRIVLSGTALSEDDARKAVTIAAQFAQGEGSVANVITIEGAQQVALKVTVAEVSRETVKQLGIDLSATFSSGNLLAGLINKPAVGGASGVINTNSITAGFSSGGFAIDATLRALERRGAVRTLAEPTLTTLSGQEAEFLAGGEFPVPVGVSDGVVTFEFKRFGVDLKFTPTVMSNGIIQLNVETKVSEPTTEGGFNAGGVTIPGTKERQAKTSVRLRSGSTLVIAGLIEDKTRQQFNEIPGISRLPILGALFRSRDFIHSQTELVIMVTPVLIEPDGPIDLPTDRFEFASDADAIFLGRMEKLYGVGGDMSSTKYQGSIGFVLD